MEIDKSGHGTRPRKPSHIIALNAQLQDWINRKNPWAALGLRVAIFGPPLLLILNFAFLLAGVSLVETVAVLTDASRYLTQQNFDVLRVTAAVALFAFVFSSLKNSRYKVFYGLAEAGFAAIWLMATLMANPDAPVLDADDMATTVETLNIIVEPLGQDARRILGEYMTGPGVARGLQLLAGLYLFHRGFDNMIEGLRKRSAERAK